MENYGPVASQDEQLMWEKLAKQGLTVGVHDPDFPDPLDGTLYVDRGRRYCFRVVCDDESLNGSQSVQHVRAESRGAIGNGHGVDLTGASGQWILLVLETFSARDCLVRVVNIMHEDPRFYRRAATNKGLGRYISISCLGGCLRPQAEAPLLAGNVCDDEATDSSPVARRDSNMGRRDSNMSRRDSQMSRRDSQMSFTSHGGSGAKMDSSWKPHVKEAKRWAKDMWASAGSTGRSARNSITSQLAGRVWRRSSVAKAEDKMADLPAEVCIDMLKEVVCGTQRSGNAMLEAIATFFPSSDIVEGRITFEKFWDACTRALLLEELCLEPLIMDNASGDHTPEDDAVHKTGSLRVLKMLRGTSDNRPAWSWTLEGWRWFLVKVQNESKEVIEDAGERMQAMRTPDVDHDGSMTLVGLARLLCSAENALFQGAGEAGELRHPLCDYWIAAAHHIYKDPPAPDEDEDVFSGSDGNEDEQLLEAVALPLRAKCRCLNFTIVEGHGGEACGGAALLVLCQSQRISLAGILRYIAQAAFSAENDTPVLLAFSLAMLGPAACARVPAALQEHLGDRLWRNTQPELPSPEVARGHVIVVLAPAAEDGDDGIVPMAGAKAAWRCALESAECATQGILETWREAARRFAVWPGFVFDEKMPNRPQHVVHVGFAPAEDLLPLQSDDSKGPHLIEYHRKSLTLVHPSAHRTAPRGFNPASAWAAGAQMAALPLGLNCTGGDLVHAGRFAGPQGQGTGYVLKPEHMRRGSSGSPLRPMGLALRVIAGRAVPGLGGAAQPKGLVSLAVSVAGALEDCDRQVFRPVKAVGSTLRWEEVVGTSGNVFFDINDPSSAILTFELLEMDTESGGARRTAAYAGPVSGIREGFRWVPLWDPDVVAMRPTVHGEISGLLVHASINQRKRSVAKRASTVGTMGLAS